MDQVAIAVEPTRRVLNRRSILPLWWWAVPLLLLAAWLGIRGLNVDTLWYDEWLSVYYAGGAQYGPVSPDVIWARVAERSTWPPGFQTLLAAWGAVAGWHHLAARVLPLLIGLLAVAWMVALGRELAGPRAGLSAAVLLGASAFFANYLHELRGYTMYALFSAMCVWAYWRITYRRAGLIEQGLFFLSVVGLLYTHYFATLTAVAVGVYHLLVVPKNRAWWRVPLLMVGAGILFLPWAGVAFATARDTLLSETRRIIPLTAGPVLATVIYSFSNGSVALLALVGLYSFRFPTSLMSRRVLWMAWLWVLCALGIALLANERLRVIFHVRHLMAVWPALALVGALGIEVLARHRLRPVVLLGLWIAAGLWNVFDARFIADQPGAEQGFDWPQFSRVLEVVGQRAEPGDALVYHVEEPGREWLTEPIVDYYSAGLPVIHTQLEEIPGLPANDDYFWQAVDFLGNAPHVWLVTMPDVPSPYHLAEFGRVLDADYAHCGAILNLRDMRLDLYGRKPRLRDLDDLPYQFEDGVNLQMLGEPVVIDGQLHALLGWSVRDGFPTYAYSYALHVTDTDGNLVAEVSAPLPEGQFTCNAAALDLTQLPPGQYRLYAVVYNWQTGERLPGKAYDGRRGDRLTVAQVTLD